MISPGDAMAISRDVPSLPVIDSTMFPERSRTSIHDVPWNLTLSWFGAPCVAGDAAGRVKRFQKRYSDGEAKASS